MTSARNQHAAPEVLAVASNGLLWAAMDMTTAPSGLRRTRQVETRGKAASSGDSLMSLRQGTIALVP